MTITLLNTVHNTVTAVRPTKSGRLNERQVKAAFKVLCGMSDCRCNKISIATANGCRYHFTPSPTGGELTAF
jgi:hypothetical protein